MSTSGSGNEGPQTERGESEDVEGRRLPDRIEIPVIRGEMVHLRPAAISDLTAMDHLEAFYNSTGITGKGPEAERAVVNAWVRRSVAWSKGTAPKESGVGDPESRRTLAWAMVSDADPGQNGAPDTDKTGGVIGMIFLIDVDGWSRSARIQVVLGKDFRGRGYSRDAMPRVMTYGYAAAPTGLGLHRIWVAVPEKNTRSISVYQSLGFMVSGTSRDALWDIENGKYQDQIVMDTLADEYDPIQSLNAFGMHVIDENPGVAQTLIARGYTAEDGRRMTAAEAQQHASEVEAGLAGNAADHDLVRGAGESSDSEVGIPASLSPSENTPEAGHHPGADDSEAEHDEEGQTQEGGGHNSSDWAYGSSKAKRSKRAWWRNLGHGRDRSNGGGR